MVGWGYRSLLDFVCLKRSQNPHPKLAKSAILRMGQPALAKVPTLRFAQDDNDSGCSANVPLPCGGGGRGVRPYMNWLGFG